MLAGAMSANLFLLLVLYYLLKGVREPLVLVSGAELKPYAAALQAVVLAVFVPVYAWLASRLTRMRLIAATLAFFVVNVARFQRGEVQGETGDRHIFCEIWRHSGRRRRLRGNDVAAAQRTGVCHRERRGDSALAGGASVRLVTVCGPLRRRPRHRGVALTWAWRRPKSAERAKGRCLCLVRLYDDRAR